MTQTNTDTAEQGKGVPPHEPEIVHVRRTNVGACRLGMPAIRTGALSIDRKDIKPGEVALTDALNPSVKLWLQAGMLEVVDAAGAPVVQPAPDAELVESVQTENAALRARVAELEAAARAPKARAKRDEE